MNIFIMCGGRGSRFNDFGTKALIEVPKSDGTMETLLARTLRLFPPQHNYIAVIGFQRHRIPAAFPDLECFTINSPDNPGSLAQSVKEILNVYECKNEAAFIHGDVLWSERAVAEFFMSPTSIVFYKDTLLTWGETFGFRFFGCGGRAVIRQAFNAGFEGDPTIITYHRGKKCIPISYGGSYHGIPLSEAKFSDVFYHLHITRQLKALKASVPVMDIDNEKDMKTAIDRIENGDFE